jgi:hypothetical protein
MIRDIHPRSQIQNPDPYFFPSQIRAPYLVSRGQKSSVSRIRTRNIDFFLSKGLPGSGFQHYIIRFSSKSKLCVFVLGSILLPQHSMLVSWSTRCNDDFLCCSDFTISLLTKAALHRITRARILIFKGRSSIFFIKNDVASPPPSD